MWILQHYSEVKQVKIEAHGYRFVSQSWFSWWLRAKPYTISATLMFWSERQSEEKKTRSVKQLIKQQNAQAHNVLFIEQFLGKKRITIVYNIIREGNYFVFVSY